MSSELVKKQVKYRQTTYYQTKRMSFSKRLFQLKGELTHKAFAEKLGISEALLRKYLNGSDPSLSKATQIADRAHCSLSWLATGEKAPHTIPGVIKPSILAKSISIVRSINKKNELNLTEDQVSKLSVTCYEYIHAVHHRVDAMTDDMAIERFLIHIAQTYFS